MAAMVVMVVMVVLLVCAVDEWLLLRRRLRLVLAVQLQLLLQ